MLARKVNKRTRANQKADSILRSSSWWVSSQLTRVDWIRKLNSINIYYHSFCFSTDLSFFFKDNPVPPLTPKLFLILKKPNVKKRW